MFDVPIPGTNCFFHIITKLNCKSYLIDQLSPEILQMTFHIVNALVNRLNQRGNQPVDGKDDNEPCKYCCELYNFNKTIPLLTSYEAMVLKRFFTKKMMKPIRKKNSM